MLDTSKINILNQDIYISDSLKKLIQHNVDTFAAHQSHKYQSRVNNGKNVDIEKVKRDIAVGKWGEYFAAYILHKEYGFPLIYPDVKQYDASHKGWDEDLPYQMHSSFPNIAVKTCNQYTMDNYGLSWMFQYNNPQDELFKGGHEDVVVACMYVPNNEPAPNEAQLVALIPWKKVLSEEVLLGEPKSSKFRGIKKTLYYDDIVEAAE